MKYVMERMKRMNERKKEKERERERERRLTGSEEDRTKGSPQELHDHSDR